MRIDMVTDEEVAEFLEHFGVKGQKWGVRRLAKKDAKWEKKSEKRSTMLSIYNKAADGANSDLPGINNKWRNVNLKKPGINQDRYHKEVSDNFNSHMTKAAEEHGLNPSGTKKLEASYDLSTGYITVSSVAAFDHADDVIRLILEKDENGLITNIKIPEILETMEQTSLIGLEFLEHYGVKGQKWGVRNGKSIRRSSPKTSSDFKTTSNLRGKHPSSLSNKQLKAINERINLEQNYKRLNPSKKDIGKSYTREVLTTIGLGVAVLNTPIGKALMSNGKKVIAARKLAKVVTALSSSGPGG